MSAGQHLAYTESPTSEDDIVVPAAGVHSGVEISGESKSHQGALSDEKLVKERKSGHGVIPLVGPSSEVEVRVEGKSCQALLDTGAMVSTLTLSLCQQLKLPIYPMSQLVQVEGVGGHSLKCLGYVIAKLDISDLHQELEAMFLVIPDIGYNCTTPVLIGTNILQRVSGSNQLPSHMKFNLQATIDHHGPSIDSGHYTASINCCKKTFYCNDHKITEFGITDKNSSTAYIVLYKWIDTWFLNSDRRVGV